MQLHRRAMLGGLLAAPFIIRTAGLIMPIKPQRVAWLLLPDGYIMNDRTGAMLRGEYDIERYRIDHVSGIVTLHGHPIPGYSERVLVRQNHPGGGYTDHAYNVHWSTLSRKDPAYLAFRPEWKNRDA